MLHDKSVKGLVLVIRSCVQEVVFAVRSLVDHLNPTAQHRTYDLISLLNTYCGI
jgi:hypothetical protein